MPKVLAGLDQEVSIASHEQMAEPIAFNWVDNHALYGTVAADLEAAGTQIAANRWVGVSEDPAVQVIHTEFVETHGYLSGVTFAQAMEANGGTLEQAVEAEWESAEAMNDAEMSIGVEIAEATEKALQEYSELLLQVTAEVAQGEGGNDVSVDVMEGGGAASFAGGAEEVVTAATAPASISASRSPTTMMSPVFL